MTTTAPRNALNWFELFVTDLKRAQAFYEKTLGISLRFEEFGELPMAIFAEEGVAGALVKHPTRKPSADGALPYLNCNGKLDACLARVEQAGGKVVMPKTDIGDPGFIALVVDTEGNTVGLHTEKNV
jgi:predicted enzyme related to lactoylglutathione lyase